MPIVNGRVTVTNDYGISIDDVGRAIGSSSRDLGTLCRSNLINEKALNKPIDLPSWHLSGPYGSPTDAERLSVNFGHTYRTENRNEPYQLITAYLQGMATWFPYNKPSNRFRLMDFFGYELAPSNWFSLETKNSAVSTTDSVVLWRLNYEFLFTHIAELAAMSNPIGTLNFGFMMWQGSTPISMHWYQVTNAANNQTLPDMLQDDKIPMYIAGKVTDGTWHIVPAFYSGNQLAGDIRPTAGSFNAMSDKDGSYPGQFYLFPYCNVATLAVTSGGGGPEPSDVELLSKIDYEVRAYTDLVDAVNLVYEIRRLDLVCTNNNDRAFNLYITSATIGRITGSGLLAQALSVPMQAGEEVSVTLSQAAEGEQGFRFVLESYEGDILPLQLLVRRFGTTSGDIAANPDYDISQKYPFIEK